MWVVDPNPNRKKVPYSLHLVCRGVKILVGLLGLRVSTCGTEKVRLALTYSLPQALTLNSHTLLGPSPSVAFNNTEASQISQTPCFYRVYFRMALKRPYKPFFWQPKVAVLKKALKRPKDWRVIVGLGLV